MQVRGVETFAIVEQNMSELGLTNAQSVREDGLKYQTSVRPGMSR